MLNNNALLGYDKNDFMIANIINDENDLFHEIVSYNFYMGSANKKANIAIDNKHDRKYKLLNLSVEDM